MADMTTAQRIPFDFMVVDGFGKPMAVDGDPVFATSDATVADGVITKVDDTHYTGFINAGTPGSAHITVTADADVSPDVNTVIAEADVTVTLDPRGAARIVKLDLKPAEDRPTA